MYRSLPGFPNRGTVTRFAVAALALALAAGEGRADEPGLPRSGATASDSADEVDPVRLIREALDRAERWNDLGEPDKALLLLHDVMDAARFHGVDTLSIRFAMAQAHLRLRRYEEAASILRELVRERPSIHRFQLDYAAALFALDRNEEARKIFLEIRRKPDLPSAVRRNVERFLRQILSQQRFRVDLDWGFWRDDNVNNAPEIETVVIPVFGQRLVFELHEQPVSAWIARTGVRVRWREPITKDRRGDIVTSASAARNTALGASEHNRTWASLSAEPRLRYKADIAGRPRFRSRSHPARDRTAVARRHRLRDEPVDRFRRGPDSFRRLGCRSLHPTLDDRLRRGERGGGTARSLRLPVRPAGHRPRLVDGGRPALPGGPRGTNPSVDIGNGIACVCRRFRAGLERGGPGQPCPNTVRP